VAIKAIIDSLIHRSHLIHPSYLKVIELAILQILPDHQILLIHLILLSHLDLPWLLLVASFITLVEGWRAFVVWLDLEGFKPFVDFIVSFIEASG
jgi:hypothetical protein